MNSNNRDSSTAAMGENIGLVASAHIDRAFRQILRGPMVVAERRFVRLITGEAHPFGNLAIVSDRADPRGTQTALEPLRACGAPARRLCFICLPVHRESAVQSIVAGAVEL
jgi:hypothetical protein